MKRPPSKPEARTLVSLRVAPALLGDVREYVLEYNRAHLSRRGAGEPDVITDSVALRRSIAAGLEVLKKELEAYRKGRAR